MELQQINSYAMIISQLPTVKPILMDNPTKSASKGDVPMSECIVRETPRDNSIMPNT